MWILIVSSSFLWFNHLTYETQEQCIIQKRIKNVDRELHDLERKSLTTMCVKKV